MKLLVTRIIDTFTEKFRIYIVEKLVAKFNKRTGKGATAESKCFLDFVGESAGRKIPRNSE